MHNRSAILAIAAGLGLAGNFPVQRSYPLSRPVYSERDTEALRKAQDKRDRKAAKRLATNKPAQRLA